MLFGICYGKKEIVLRTQLIIFLPSHAFLRRVLRNRRWSFENSQGHGHEKQVARCLFECIADTAQHSSDCLSVFAKRFPPSLGSINSVDRHGPVRLPKSKERVSFNTEIGCDPVFSESVLLLEVPTEPSLYKASKEELLFEAVAKISF